MTMSGYASSSSTDPRLYLSDTLTAQMGYWVDVSGLQFDEQRRSWIQALPLGKYLHPIYGTIEVTSERIKRFAQNVKAKVRGTDLDVDYDHKQDPAQGGRAAGWIRDAQDRADGLWVEVEWTEPALQSIKRREYRYFSPEFANKWKHPQTGVEYQDVLFGGGLTNRPFLKNILPINLTEVLRDQEERIAMSEELLKSLRTWLQLPDDASEEQVLGALQSRLSQEGEGKGEGETQEPPTSQQPPAQPQTQPQPQAQAASEGESDEVRRLNERIAQLETAYRLSEVNARLREWSSGQSHALPVALHDQVRDMLVGMPRQHAEKVETLVSALLKDGLTELGERGTNQPNTPGTGAVKRFNDRVDELMKDGKMSYADAAEQIAGEDPQLFRDFQEESFLLLDQEA